MAVLEEVFAGFFSPPTLETEVGAEVLNLFG